MAKLLLIHAPHMTPRLSHGAFTSKAVVLSRSSLPPLSTLIARPQLAPSMFLSLRSFLPSTVSINGRSLSARAFDDSSASATETENERQQKEEGEQNLDAAKREEDYPSGEFVFENANAWKSLVVKLRMLIAFPWQRIRKGSVLTIKLRGQDNSPMSPAEYALPLGPRSTNSRSKTEISKAGIVKTSIPLVGTKRKLSLTEKWLMSFGEEI